MSADLIFAKDVIRNRRRQLGISQADLARAVGIQSPVYICMIEAGRRSVPPEKAAAMAQVLGVDSVEFCELVLFEHYPQLYSVLFGCGRPHAPKVLNS